MADLLRRLRDASRRRVAASRRRCPDRELRRRAKDAPAAVPLRLDPRGFDLIAEIKPRSPSAGRLMDPGDPPARVIRDRAADYEAGGAAAVSVLTEPTAFDGALAHLSAACAAVQVPVIRKDFLVDPYQILEARAKGASGVLLIVRILPGDLLERMLDACAALGMFAVVEVFDPADARRIATLGVSGPGADSRPILLGVNARDLRSLAIHDESLERLAAYLPVGVPTVAESGLATEEDIARAAFLGYDLALVGTALMRSDRPRFLTASLIQAGRRTKARASAGGAR
jgi:indole-3-glycerol phosphate synthase